MVDRRLRQNALAFAARKHRGQFRIGGAPYITHPVAVAEILEEEGCGTETVVTGLLHDLLEDTDAKESEIEAIAGERVLRAVRTLTKTPGYVMADYVAAIRDDPIAFAVKGVDRLHKPPLGLIHPGILQQRPGHGQMAAAANGLHHQLHVEAAQ